jgi:tetratricopeptide (TPR) repeat protein
VCTTRSAARLYFGFVLTLTAALGQSAGTVSAEELRHPLSRKANKVLRKVLKRYLAGDDTAMNNELQHALEMPDAAPYALKMRGLLDLNRKDLREARKELQQAVKALPWDAEAKALLAYAIYCGGYSTSGAYVSYKALAVDPNQPLAHFVLAMVLFDERREGPALEHLKTAATLGLLPAQVRLADFYARSGHPELADQTWQAAEANSAQIPERRVREDTRRWLKNQPGFSGTLLH